MTHDLSQNKWPTADGLRVGHLNINSAINKIHEVEILLQNFGTPFHIFGLTEARVTNKVLDSDIVIPGYTLERRHPQQKLETGIITYISASLNAKRLEHLEQYIESIWLEIKIKNTTPILVGIIYRNPDERVEWADRFCNSLCLETST